MPRTFKLQAFDSFLTLSEQFQCETQKVLFLFSELSLKRRKPYGNWANPSWL